MAQKRSQGQIEITPGALKKWRKEKRFSAFKASKAAKVDRATWGRWERGLSEPSEENKAVLRKLLSAESNYFGLESASVETIKALRPGDLITLDTYTRLLAVGLDLPSSEGDPCPQEMEGGLRGAPIGRLALIKRRYKRLWLTYGGPDNKPTKYRLLGELQFLFACAGYFFGRVKYAPGEYQLTHRMAGLLSSLETEIISALTMLKERYPKNSDQWWYRASQKFHAGYALAMDEQFCPKDTYLESWVLNLALNNKEALKVVASELSSVDFSDTMNGLIFTELQDLYRKGEEVTQEAILAKASNDPFYRASRDLDLHATLPNLDLQFCFRNLDLQWKQHAHVRPEKKRYAETVRNLTKYIKFLSLQRAWLAEVRMLQSTFPNPFKISDSYSSEIKQLIATTENVNKHFDQELAHLSHKGWPEVSEVLFGEKFTELWKEVEKE